MMVGALLFYLAQAAAAPVCEPSSPVVSILQAADQPHDRRISLAEHRRRIRSVLEAGLEEFPEDPFLHGSLIDLELGRFGEARPALIDEYGKRLEASVGNADRQYLAALSMYSMQTGRARDLLVKLLAKQPKYGPALLLQARIASSRSFSNPALVQTSLRSYHEACPSTPGTFPELVFIEDAAFLSEWASLLRLQVGRRSDLLALRVYPVLWRAEQNSRRSDQLAGFQKTWAEDVERIRKGGFPVGALWVDTLQAAAFQFDQNYGWMGDELSKTYPHAQPSLLAKVRPIEKLGARPETYAKLAEMCRIYPASPGIPSHWISLAYKDRAALPDAFMAMKKAMELDPESYLSLPPYQITMADELVKYGQRVELVPELVFAGIQAAEQQTARTTISDLYPGGQKARDQQHDSFLLYAYYALLESYAKLGKYPEARDVVSQAQVILNRMRPSNSPAPEDKDHFGHLEASFWRIKGLLAEKQSKTLDALVAYRNALVAYPPQSNKPDGREAVLASARALAKTLGGSDEGWQDWEAKQPLEGFSAGNGGPNAWAKLAAKKPGIVVKDMRGKEHRVEDLATRTSFVNIWATWCLPCRAELPYMEKLAKQFEGRDDIVFVALNVDEEEEIVPPFLKQFKFEFVSVPAYKFAYDMLPVFGVPANYLITPAKTTYIKSDKTGDDWVAESSAKLRP